MFIQRYVSALVDAVLGKYVKNLDPEALKISVWSGAIEIEAVELQPGLPIPGLPEVRVVQGTLHQLRINVPWHNLANQPMEVAVEDVSLLLEVAHEDENASSHTAEGSDGKSQRQEVLQRKRATIDAIEQATSFREQQKTQQKNSSSDEGGWANSFFLKLLVKLVDNVQLSVQRVHIRLEDRQSNVQQPYAVGITLQSLVMHSADEDWNYTMDVRGGGSPSALLRKKLEVHRFGIYWSLPLQQVPLTVFEDSFAFTRLMQRCFWATTPEQLAHIPALIEDSDYLIAPLSLSMKLTVNDGDGKLALTHQELSARVLSRLGTPWMVETIDMIGDDAWDEFVQSMPSLAGGRKYTLGFVFSEAWAVAREWSEEEDAIPTLEQFKQALSSCLLWSVEEVNRVERSIIKYREAVVQVMDEKTTYIDAQADIDHINVSLSRDQYLSQLSFVSFLTSRRRRKRIAALHPKQSVKQNPRAWWRFAIEAVLLDVRERIGREDWRVMDHQRRQRKKYMELYLRLWHSSSYAATLISKGVKEMSSEEAATAFDDLEYELETPKLLSLRRAVRKDMAKKELLKPKSTKTSEQTPQTNATWWSWLRGTTSSPPSQSEESASTPEDERWSEQDTKKLYEAIDFHPEEESIGEEDTLNAQTESDSEKASNMQQVQKRKKSMGEQQRVLYRVQSTLKQATLQLGWNRHSGMGKPRDLLLAEFDDMNIQFLVRPSSLEVGLQLHDAYFCQNASDLADIVRRVKQQSVFSTRDFFLERMDMNEILENHPEDVQQQMSSVRLRHCERELPVLDLSLALYSEEHDPDDANGSVVAEEGEVAGSHATAQYSRVIRVSLVTQAIKCNINLVFLLNLMSFFQRPVNVDLSRLENTAWRNAQRLQRYSTHQLKEALARRTKLEMQLDVVSPWISIVRASVDKEKESSRRVGILLFLGHLRASTLHPTKERRSSMTPHTFSNGEGDLGSGAQEFMVSSPTEEHLYDVIDFFISGVEVRVLDSVQQDADALTGDWQYLLEKTSLKLSSHLSVAPRDPTIPLVKLVGDVATVQLNLSASSFRSLLSLVYSFAYNVSDFKEQNAQVEEIVDVDENDQASSKDTRSSSSQVLLSPPHSSHGIASAMRKKKRMDFMSTTDAQSGSSERTSGGDDKTPLDNGVPSSPTHPFAATESFGTAATIAASHAEKDLEDRDLMKLWRRVLCHMRFHVGEIVLRLQVKEMDEPGTHKVIEARLGEINTRVKIRSYDRRLEFGLGTFVLEDMVLSHSTKENGKPNVIQRRFIMESGEAGEKEMPKSTSEHLIRWALTSVSSDAPLPKDKGLCKYIAYETLVPDATAKYSVWQDPLVTPLSLEASLRTLTIHVRQDTMAEIIVFFFSSNRPTEPEPPKETESSPKKRARPKSNDLPDLTEEDLRSVSSSDRQVHESLSRRLGVWVKSSLLENVADSSYGSDTKPPSWSKQSTEAEEKADTPAQEGDKWEDLPAKLQLRLHVDGLTVFLHQDEKEVAEGASSAIVSLSTEKFCGCIHKFPRYMNIFASLSSLKLSDTSLTDRHHREIVSHATSLKAHESPTLEKEFGHVPTVEEVLQTLEEIPAVFSCAMQFYGPDNIQEAWHPGYSNRFSVRLKSPRIRVLYRFVDDIRNYFFNGILLQTVMSVWYRARPEMSWEGDFQLAQVATGQSFQSHTESNDKSGGESTVFGSDVVSMFPLLDVQMDDAVLEMPPHRVSSEALILRYDRFKFSNVHVLNEYADMDNRVLAKVLLNSSLSQLKMEVSTLRIVSNILLFTDDAPGMNSGGSFMEQSLLGSTDIHLDINLRTLSAIKVDIDFTPVRLVCNQEQYAFLLRVPFQNLQERSRYRFPMRSAVELQHLLTRGGNPERPTTPPPSEHFEASGFSTMTGDIITSITSEVGEESEDDAFDEVGEQDEKHATVVIIVPELTMELLRGYQGYQPSSSGDLSMADKDKKYQGSICVLDFTKCRTQVGYAFTTRRLESEVTIDGIHVRDSRAESHISESYRDVVVFEQPSEDEWDMLKQTKSVQIRFVKETRQVEAGSIKLEASDNKEVPSGSQDHSRGNSNLSNPPSSSETREKMTSSNHVQSSTRSRGGLRKRNTLADSVTERSKLSNSHSRLVYGRDIAESSAISQRLPGRPLVDENRMELNVDVLGFRVIPSNIHYDIVRFVLHRVSSAAYDSDNESTTSRSDGRSSESGEDGDEDEVIDSEQLLPSYRLISINLTLGPSAVLLVEDPFRQKSRALRFSWDASLSLDYLRTIYPNEYMGIQDFDWMVDRNQVFFKGDINNIHATSRLSKDSVWAGGGNFSAATADCLKPIGLGFEIQMDLATSFLDCRVAFDRIMDLRFGYLDFCTTYAALESILRMSRSRYDSESEGAKRPRAHSSSSVSSATNVDRSPPSSSSSSSASGMNASMYRTGLAGSRKRSNSATTKYGTSLIYLISASFRGRLQTRPVVGIYNSPWRKRYLVLPYTPQERNLVESVAFRILPAPGSTKEIGDEVYYGDRIILEVVPNQTEDMSAQKSLRSNADGLQHQMSSSRSPEAGGLLSASMTEDASARRMLISKYDRLGANGYLGLDGAAGTFETTIWKHGTTVFNSEKSVVFDRDVIALEEMTIYRTFSRAVKNQTSRTPGNRQQPVQFGSRGKKKPDMQELTDLMGTSAKEGGGYLMFNGVGDAPIPFALSISTESTKVNDSAETTNENETKKRSDSSDTMDKAKLPAKTLLDNLKVIEFSLPGVNATIVNDYNNMLLPLLHLRVSNLHLDVRGQLDQRFSALAQLRCGVQAYNSQLAVWEPFVEDFNVDAALHGRGGALCDYCLSERQQVSPTGIKLQCAGLPTCLFRPARTEVFTEALAHSWQSKHFIYRELLHRSDGDDGTVTDANTFVLVIKEDLNINLSRNVVNVMLHFVALVTRVAPSDERLAMRLGPFIYVDNKSGIPFRVARNQSSASGPPPSDGVNLFNKSRNELQDMVQPSLEQGLASPTADWITAESGERVATNIVAHEAPAGSVTSPLRRLLWLKPLPPSTENSSPQSTTSSSSATNKAVPVPIGYSNRSFLHLDNAHGSSQDPWRGESIICETVAEQGTLVLRLRSKVQIANYLSVPVELVYNNGEYREVVSPSGEKHAHYVPVQFLSQGEIAFCPMLEGGRLHKSNSFRIESLVQPPDTQKITRTQSKSTAHAKREPAKMRRALTFYWDVHPEADTDESFEAGRPPFQLVLSASRKANRHETHISLRAPVQLENLIPFSLLYRTVCLKSESDVGWIEGNEESFTGTHGRIASGDHAHISELEMLMDGRGESMQELETPTVVALSVSLPEVRKGLYSQWKYGTFVYGTASVARRLELDLGPSYTEDGSARQLGKLPICVEVEPVDKARSIDAKEQIVDPLAPVIVRLYCEYWLIDRTGLGLHFYTPSGARITTGRTKRVTAMDEESTDGVTASSVSLAVYSGEPSQKLSRMKIGVPSTRGREEVRSEVFDTGAVGIRGQVLVPSSSMQTRRLEQTTAGAALFSIGEDTPASNGSTTAAQMDLFKQHEFGVIVEQGPAKFSRSKVVTLVHRHYFVNSSDRFQVHIRQEGSLDERAIVRLGPRESNYFHWSDSRLRARVQVRFVLPEYATQDDGENKRAIGNTSEWSSPFELSSVGNFVLRLKKPLQRAPSYLPQCLDDRKYKESHPEDYIDELDVYYEERQMLSSGLKLSVAVELHDPSVVVYLEEGEKLEAPPPSGNTDPDLEMAVEASRDEGNRSAFVPFKIKNECSNLELVVWQKTLAGDAHTGLRVGFEGGDLVRPFQTVDYVPYAFAGQPCVFVQVQTSIGLDDDKDASDKKSKRNAKRRRRRRNSGDPLGASASLPSGTNTQVLTSFEIQLNKLHRLPTMDLSDKKTKRRLWVEVRLDETAKTLLVTDMLPGDSSEHKRRRRATLLRSWKRYNAAVLSLSRLIAAHSSTYDQPDMFESMNEGDEGFSRNSRKHVHFAGYSPEKIDEQQLDMYPAFSGVTRDRTVETDTQNAKIALCVRLVHVLKLEELYRRHGTTDWASCRPYVTIRLETTGQHTESKIYPQAAAILPRWVPILTDKKKAPSPELQLLIGAGDDKLDATLVIEIREPDRYLFGSTLLSVLEMPLQKYLENVRTSQHTYEPLSALQFLAPVEMGDQSEDKTMIRLEMCAEYYPPGSLQDSDESVDAFERVQRAMRLARIKRQLESLRKSRTDLRGLLEKEAVDISTGHHDKHLPSVSTAASVASKTVSSDKKIHRSRRTSLSEMSDTSSVTSMSVASSVATEESKSSDDAYDDLRDERQLTAVMIGVSNLQVPASMVRRSGRRVYGSTERKEVREPKVYCTITYKESTRSAMSAVAKRSSESEAKNELDANTGDGSESSADSSPDRHRHVRTYEFAKGQRLGLDLVYQNGRVLVQGVLCGDACGQLLHEGKVRIGDTVVAVDGQTIVNLHREASFRAIEKARQLGTVDEEREEEAPTTFTLSFLDQPMSQRPTWRSQESIERSDEDRGKEEEEEMAGYDAEWNRRVEFVETAPSAGDRTSTATKEESVLVRVYLRNDAVDHGLSNAQESSVVPFLYFFGDDSTMDHLDHSKQDSRFDELLGECWVPLPPFNTGDATSAFENAESVLSSAVDPLSIDSSPDSAFYERVCALYLPRTRSGQSSRRMMTMIGELRLALKWDLLDPLATAKSKEDLRIYSQIEMAHVCVSVIDDASSSAPSSSSGQAQEVLNISMSNKFADAGIQLSYAYMSSGKHVLNASVGHFQIDNQMLDTDYPVFLHPMRLIDNQVEQSAPDEDGADTSPSIRLLPTFQLMTVFGTEPGVARFDYIFAQLQELEIKLEDSTLVALAHVLRGVNWGLLDTSSGNSQHERQPSKSFADDMTGTGAGYETSEDQPELNLALRLLEKEWSSPVRILASSAGAMTISSSAESHHTGTTKVLLRWLLLCPVKVNVTFTSTADRARLLSLLSPDMSSTLRAVISAAAALMSNLDQAPIKIPEFYVENLLETTRTLAFYGVQHYVHHGLRSWYNLMGSVDVLGNPIGLVSTLGTGVKDFFYTPAQMLLDDEDGSIRISNLRTGMTKGSKSLLRNTAVGIFHTTGKITETLGKGLSMLALDDQYTLHRQRQLSKQSREIQDLGGAITVGSRGLIGGLWDGVKGVVSAPVEGAEVDGAGGFVLGIGKGFAGLVVKPTAGFLDLLTSLSRGAKSSAEAIDGGDHDFQTVTRFRLPRRFCADGVIVSYSSREAKGYAVLLLTSLDKTDEYVYHVDYGLESRGMVLLTDKRVVCLSAKSGQKLWELALDSTLVVQVAGIMLSIGQASAAQKTYNIECDNEIVALNFQVAVDSARVDPSATRYLLLNLEKNQEEETRRGMKMVKSKGRTIDRRDAGTERTDLRLLMENVQDTKVTGLSEEDLQAQPLRSVRVELCHLHNQDAHSNVPSRTVDHLLSFTVFQIQVYGGPYQWTVFRRYSQFRELVSALEASGYNLDSMPSLPPRTFLPSTRDAVAKHRQEALTVFLQAAVMHSAISRSSPMLEFVTSEAQEMRVSLPPRSPGILGEDDEDEQ